MVRRVDSLHRISCTLLLLLATTGLPSALGKWRPVHSKHALAGIAAEREDRSSARLSAGGDRTPLAPQGVVVDQFGELVDLTVPVDDEEFDDPLPVRTTLAQHGDPPASAGAGSLERSHAEGVAEHSKLKSGARYCTNANFNQASNFSGSWVDHPIAGYTGLYDVGKDCPEYAKDFDCRAPNDPADANPELAAKEYRKVFMPDQCQLREFDAPGFDRCMKGRRLIMIGDSLMRQHFSSLGCLLAKVLHKGNAGYWEDSEIKHQGEYTKKWGEAEVTTLKQFLGDLELHSGGQVILRSFGTYNTKLWDDVMSDFEPLTANDIVMVNFGAWYPRFKQWEHDTPWVQWQADVKELFMEKLAPSPAQAIWKDYSPTHFSGQTGTYTGIEESLEGVPGRPQCDAATVGEYWYRDWIADFLKTCGQPCSNIRVLPIFDLSLSRHDSHHGSFGRGRGQRTTDCRHFCQNVVDVWSTVLFNMLCST